MEWGAEEAKGKTMTRTLIKGRLLSFQAKPQNASDTSCFEYIASGALLIENGLIVWKGHQADFELSENVTKIIDHGDDIVMAGFIDTHCHYSQTQVIASFGEKLLDWLNNYTFIEEAKFTSVEHANRIAQAFFEEIINHGTTTVAAYCTVHTQSVNAFFEAASQRNMRVIGGQVLMDRNAPQDLCVDPNALYDQSQKFIKKWDNYRRCHYAVTPRFAITSTPEMLEVSGALVKANKSCYMQTHLSENTDEIGVTMNLFPDAKDYLDVYDRFELLGDKSLFGHCIHLSDREIGRLSETNSRAIYCPTSNLFLGSGLFDLRRLSNAGVSIGIATDIGAGTTYSMLGTLGTAYGLCQLNSFIFNPLLAFYMITLGNAIALQLDDKIGTLDIGSEADIIVLNSRATSAMKTRMETVTSLQEELFVLQILGDNRSVSQVYIMGEASKKYP